MVDIVQCYDPDNDEWTKTFCLPAALGGIRACTLTILSSFASLRGSTAHGRPAGGSTDSGDTDGAGKQVSQ